MPSFKAIVALGLAAVPVVLGAPLLASHLVVTAAASPHTEHVVIQGFAFKPKALTIKPGTMVIWTQKDQAPHTVTSTTSAWKASPDLKPNQTFSHTFTKVGTYHYYCAVHPGMTATIVVSKSAKN